MRTVRRTPLRVLAAAGMFVAVFAGTAGATTVDFDQLPAGTVVTNQYADLGGPGQGVVFGPLPGGLAEGLHPVVRVPPGPPGQAQSGAQVADIGTCNCEFFLTPRTTGMFAVPRSMVSVRVGYLGPDTSCDKANSTNACAEPVLRAFDAGGQQVAASVPLFVQQGNGVHTLLSVSTPTATIVGFEISGSSANDRSKQIAIDDLTFDVPAAPPPPDFTLTTPVHTVEVAQGSSTAVPITIGRIGRSVGTIAFSVAGGLPAGVQAQLAPNATDGATATLTLTADAAAPLTQTPATLTVTGTPSSPAAGAAPRPLTLAVIVKRNCAGVSTRQELVDAVASGRKCIVVRSDAKIDLATGDPIATDPFDAVLHIPDGVSLESGRSATSLGGVLSMSHPVEGKKTMLDLGANTRVTGLRLLGYNHSATRDVQDRTSAIRTAADGISIDSNEIAGWPNASVEITGAHTTRLTADRIRITENFIHNNVQCGAGYGVVIGTSGYAHIDHNVFTFNRHDVADDGQPATGYIADHNFILTGGPTCGGFYNQHFDMHGVNTKGKSHDGGAAGEFMDIRHNTIRGDQSYGFLGGKTRPAFELRGTPSERAVFSNNVVAHEDEDAAVRIKGVAAVPVTGVQPTIFLGGRAVLKTAGKLVVSGNRYGVDTSRELAVGDFDGDGRADVFQSVGTVWVYSPSGRRAWRILNESTLRLGRLAFGDFDGDRRTDVFSQAGAQWRVSYGGTGPWTRLPAGSNIGMRSYHFADFDGDGKTDIFRANGSRFFVSSGGATSWRSLAQSGLRIDKLRFGDFDGDGRTDVFSLANGQWSVSDGDATRWRRLNAKRSANLGELVFADFTGDGRTDIARRHAGRWEISSAGATPWRRLQSRPQPSFVGTLVADFTGDRRADVLQFGAPRPPPALFADLTRYNLSGAGTGPLSTWSAQDMR